MNTSGFAPASRFLLVAAAFVVVVAGLRAAAPVLNPFLLAVFLAVLMAPLMAALRRWGLGPGLSLTLTALSLVALELGLASLVGGSVTDFSANLPHYQEALNQRFASFQTWIDGWGLHLPWHLLSDLLEPGRVMALAGQVLGGLGSLLADAFLVLLTTLFLLLEGVGLPAKLKSAMKHPEQALKGLGQIAHNINHYMGIKAATSLLTGILVALWLGWLGVDFAVLWGVLAFLLNFVPNIGSIIAAVPPMLLALVQPGPAAALWTLVGYLVINNLVGNLLEPRLMGRGLGLSALVVFVSLVFWGWVLGPVGMFLAVPLTMALKIALDATPATRPMAVLLGYAPRDRSTG